TQVYGKYLGRTPSSGEVNIWLPVLRQPPAGAGSPSALESFIAQVVSSVEYLQAQKDPGTNPPTYSNASWVESIYVKVLGRASDPAGFSQALNAVLAGYYVQRRDLGN